MKKPLLLALLGVLIPVLMLNTAYAAGDIWGDILGGVQDLLPYILASPLLFILLFKFWGVPLVEILLKLKWVVVMVIPTIVLYISMPEIIDYAWLNVPEWFMFISPPLVIDSIIGYSVAMGDSLYLTIGFVWLAIIYFIAIFLILSEKRQEKTPPTDATIKKTKSNYYYIFSPILVWIIIGLWGMLMVNVHTFVFNAISGAISTELVGGTGLQIGVIIAVVFGLIIVLMVVSKIRSPRDDPTKKMTLLYCKDVEGKVVCVYDPKKEEKDGHHGKKKKKKKKKSKKGGKDKKEFIHE